VSSPESFEAILRERERSKWVLWLAVMILLAFFGFYGLALLSGIFSSPDDYSGVEKVASTLGPIAASVIGYYFGQRPVQALTEQVQKAAAEGQEARAGLREAGDQTGIDNQQIRDLRDQIRTKDEIIERLIREAGQSNV
jgi:hypothetical protein